MLKLLLVYVFFRPKKPTLRRCIEFFNIFVIVIIDFIVLLVLEVVFIKIFIVLLIILECLIPVFCIIVFSDLINPFDNIGHEDLLSNE